MADVGNLDIARLFRGQVNTRKNYIINGNFNFWQRGTSVTYPSGYAACDRWSFDFAGDGVFVSVARSSFTLGQTDVPGEPQYYCSAIFANGAVPTGSFAKISQKIENVALLQDETIVLSFYAKSDHANDVAVEFVQNFGTGGSSSGGGGGVSPDVVSIGVNKFSLTSSWQKFIVTTYVPSITGKSITTGDTGQANNTYFEINFWFDATAEFNVRTDSIGRQTGSIHLSRVQLEKGSYPTNFEEISYKDELALCQRYYYQTYPEGYHPGDIIELGAVGDKNQDPTSVSANPFRILFPVVMRETPTVTVYAPSNGASGEADNYGAGYVYQGRNTFNVFQNISDQGILGAGFTDNIPANDYFLFHLTAEAEL